MSVVSGGAVGSQRSAKAGVNREQKESTVPAGSAWTSGHLVTAGMPSLTWLLTCSQAHSVLVQPQVALRRTGVGVDAYEFIDAAPITAVSSSAPYVFELNAPVQAMRLVLTNPGTAPGDATNITLALMASG